MWPLPEKWAHWHWAWSEQINTPSNEWISRNHVGVLLRSGQLITGSVLKFINLVKCCWRQLAICPTVNEEWRVKWLSIAPSRRTGWNRKKDRNHIKVMKLIAVSVLNGSGWWNWMRTRSTSTLTTFWQVTSPHIVSHCDQCWNPSLTYQQTLSTPNWIASDGTRFSTVTVAFDYRFHHAWQWY